MRTLLTCLSLSFLSTFSLLSHDTDKIIMPVEVDISMQIQRFKATPEEVVRDCSVAYRWVGNDTSNMEKIHPNAYYAPFAINAFGDNLELNDGSVWLVNPNHRRLVKGWNLSDLILIKPNASWYSKYSYVIQNKITQDVIEVNLLDAPHTNSMQSFFIEDLDPVNGMVRLNDGTVWKINPSDKSFKFWAVGQRILVGVNSYWRSWTYSQIFINASIYNAPYCEADFSSNQ